jgi:hypothetical protein
MILLPLVLLAQLVPVSFSSQCHWRAPGIGMDVSLPAHTHNDMKFPYLQDISGRFTVPFTIIMYHTNGKIINIAGSTTGTDYSHALPCCDSPAILTYSWTLDNGAKLPLVGDVNGVVTYTGQITFDLVQGGARYAHGFMPISFRTYTRYDNGDTLVNTLSVPLHSVQDLTKPENGNGDGAGQILESRCEIAEAHPTGTEVWGTHAIQTRNALPTLVSFDWLVQFTGYNYGIAQNLLPPGLFEFRIDPDFHNLNFGIVLDSEAGLFQSSNIDNLLNVPTGIHKLMFRWIKADFDNTKELSANLVFTVNVGPGGVMQPPLYTPFLGATNGVVPLPPPPACTAGDSGTVVVDNKTYKVTIDSNCNPTVVRL